MSQRPRKYRMKPTVVRAMQWTGQNADDLLAWVGEENFQANAVVATLKTSGGWCRLFYNDWVCRSDTAWFSMSPERFAGRYEPAILAIRDHLEER